MTLGITGASGQLGAGILKHLYARHAPSGVVAITRHTAKVEAAGRPGLQVRPGDFNDGAGLAKALVGVERLVMIPASDLIPGVRPRQHKTAIDAAVAAGVKHIIYVSSVGARPGPRDGILETHFFTEQAVIGSGVPWTLVRMNIYTDFQIEGVRRAVASGEYVAPDGAPYAYVVRDDLAAMAAAVMATDGHEGVTYHATGPESVTHAQIAMAVATATGKPLKYVPLSADEHEAGLTAAGLPPVLVEVLGRSSRQGRAGAFDLVTGDVERLTGKRAQAPIPFLTNAL
jgi:NAD(P)H dehydrogenase (quinone)